MSAGGYVRGEEIYPSVKAAPNWRWKKRDGIWIEINRPDPLYCAVYFPAAPLHSSDDYPPSLHREVDRANRLSNMQAFRPIALATAAPTHLFETLELQRHGSVSLGIYRVSEGYTKTANYADEGGFFLHPKGTKR